MHFRERLTPPITWLTLFAALGASFGLIAYPINAAGSILAMVLLGAVTVAVLWVTSPQVSVEDTELRAGPAHIDTAFLSEITVLDGPDVREALSDPRTFAVYRPYLRRAVKAMVNDPRDPTPYWLISTARPDELVRALS